MRSRNASERFLYPRREINPSNLSRRSCSSETPVLLSSVIGHVSDSIVSGRQCRTPQDVASTGMPVIERIEWRRSAHLHTNAFRGLPFAPGSHLCPLPQEIVGDAGELHGCGARGHVAIHPLGGIVEIEE